MDERNKGAPFSVLIPVAAAEEKYDGVANFLGKLTQKVAIVRPEHFAPSKQFAALAQLRDAHESEDWDALGLALEALYGAELAKLWKLPQAPSLFPKKAERFLPKELRASQLKTEPKLDSIRFAAPLHLTQEFTRAMRRARFVLWWNWRSKQFVPAIYCPNVKVAQWVLAAMRDLRACPFCGKLFMPYRPDQFYCSIQHRENFRKRKQRAKERRK